MKYGPYVIVLSIIGITVYIMLRPQRRIIHFAEEFLGQEEIAGNLGFKSKKMQYLMLQVGWRSGDAWCVYFSKVIWYNMAPDFLKPLILQKVTGNSQTTWKNIIEDTSGVFKASKYPQRGDMVIWQLYKDGKPQWRGHSGIVTDVETNFFSTIEGNTNINDLQGYIVSEKERKYDFDKRQGLRLKGFLRIAV